MTRQGRYNPGKHRNSQIVLIIFLVLALVAVGAIVWFLFRESNDAATQVETTEITTAEEPSSLPVLQEPQSPEFDAVALQNTLDEWVSQTGGNPAVTLVETDGTVLASYKPEQSFFAASIYKIYVAYAGYQQVDAGLVDPKELYINGHTRAECLDLMIRESDSPCAEKLWNEIGKQELTDQLVDWGITNTDMSALTTTSADAAKMLARIAGGVELSGESQLAYMTSMKEQIYRDALNQGFSGNVVVYNKVGFRQQVEYHDTATVEFSDGRQMIVSVITENVGASNIANLGTMIEETVSVTP